MHRLICSKMSGRRAGFTLIELLVVIAIIAILAAILFPVFAQAKLAAKKSQSLSNEKQILLASKMYLNDNDDMFHLIRAVQANPDPLNWAYGSEDMLLPYIKSLDLFGSPGDSVIRDDCGTPFGKKVSYSWSHYRDDDIRVFGLHGYNHPGWTPAQMRPSLTEGAVGAPAATIHLYELWTTSSYSNGYAYYRWYSDQLGFPGTGSIPTWPKTLTTNWCGTGDGRMSMGAYGDQCNYGFADGHVKSMKREQTVVQVYPWTTTQVNNLSRNLWHFDERFKN